MSDTFTVERKQHISASPDAVFAKIRDLREWDNWSPWAAMDPDMDKTYSTDQGDVGASYEWSGNRKVGQGRMTTTAIDGTSMTIDLEFLKPFKSQNVTRLDVVPSGDGSEVTWHMEGPKTLMTKIMGIFKSMDKMIGPDFEKGLASLKGLAEA